MIRIVSCALLLSLTTAAAVFAQAKPRPAPPPLPPPTLELRGYAMLGMMNFTAADTFDASLGSPYGSILGGGARAGLPLGGLFIDAGVWHFRGTGERVFVFEGQTFPLGVPLRVSITPLEIGGGWRFRFRRVPKFRPYVGGGFTSYHYRETSDFATTGENVDEWFTGYHLAGGVDARVHRWIGLAGEVNWTTLPDSIGEAGLSAAFNERNAGGTSVRVKILIGR